MDITDICGVPAVKFLLQGLLILVCTNSVSAAVQLRPNILLLMAEDMSARVGAFGDAIAVTPNLDALAAQGVRYPNMFTTAGVCAPSRAAHILGMHQVATGTQHMRTSSRPEGGYYAVPPDGVKAYPELLRAAGYYTYTDFKLDYQFSHANAYSGPFTIWDAEASEAMDWRDRAAGQPFFGLINFMETHESGVFTPLGNMPNSFIHLVMQGMRWWRMDGEMPEVVSPEQVKVPPYYPDTPAVREDMSRHYNNIALMDRRVGKILTQLEADGVADNTIVIWTTDHGDGLPRAKRELHDAGTRVPMIIRWPDRWRPGHLRQGELDERLLSFVDLAPTILSLAGVEAPDYLHGQNFLDRTINARTHVLSSRDRIDEIPDRQRSVRDESFRYIRSWNPELAMGHSLKFRDNIAMVREMRQLYNAGRLNADQARWFESVGEERLFDIKTDPHELTNLVGDPAYADELQRLRKILVDQLAQIGDREGQAEIRLVEQFQPAGKRPVTSAPSIAINNNIMTVETTTSGSSIGYSLNDGDNWLLYHQPVVIPAGAKVRVKAVRYGWQASSEIRVK